MAGRAEQRERRAPGRAVALDEDWTRLRTRNRNLAHSTSRA